MTESETSPRQIKAVLDQETEQALHEALERFEAVQRAARVLAATDALKPALQSVVDIAANALQADQVTLYTFDLSKRKVELALRGGPGAAALPGDPGFPPGDGLLEPAAGWALEAWRPGRATPDAPLRAWPGAEREPISWTTLTAPLIYSQRILGVLKASNPPEQPPFNRADEALLTTLANQAALAVESHRLWVEERAQRKQADTLREVARILNYSLDQQRLLEMILDQLARVVDYDSASIMLLNGEQLHIAAARRFRNPAEQLNIPTQLSVYQHIRELIDRRRPVIIEDTSQDVRWQQYPVSGYIQSWLGVPLVGRDQVIGLLNLDKETPRFYTQPDAALASTFANQAAIAIENSRLYAIERQRAEQLNALRATVADISGELELPRLLQSILQRAVAMLNATGGDIGLYEEISGEVIILGSYRMGRDFTGVRMKPGEGAMGLAVQTRRPVIVEDYAHWVKASPQYSPAEIHAAIAMPFMIGRRIVGVIGMMDSDSQRRFGPADQHLLSLFAQHAAIAVENARLFLQARQATERRNILHQVSQDIVAVNMDPEAIYRAIHQAVARLMPAEAFVITRLKDDPAYAEAVYLVDRSGRTG
ncbi:MAG: GAF domain-containing protein, partial [Chloroflexota bacterium]